MKNARPAEALLAAQREDFGRDGEERAAVPLCVDLDGTLIATDVLHEGLGWIATHDPLALLRVPGWWRRGRQHVKSRVAALADVPAVDLPLRPEVVELIRRASADGRQVIVVTAAADEAVQDLAAVVPGVSEVVGSTERRGNLSGERKAAYLVDRFGPGGFDYVGDSSADLAVWATARSAFAVAPSSAVARRLDALDVDATVLPAKSSAPRSWLRQIRLHQAAKNALVFAPLVLAHEIFDLGLLGRALAMAVAFTMLASATYIWNDLHDLADDRAHPSKRFRPLAAGDIGILPALAAALALTLGALALGFALGLPSLAILLAYLSLTLWYSARLKRMIVADAIALAALFTLRILGGAAATALEVTIWLILVSTFLFFSLSLMKRYSEYVKYEIESSPGRGYFATDAATLQMLGVGSALVSALVMGLYVASDDVVAHYSTPELLWAVVPLLLYWVSRLWILTGRGHIDDDPVLYAIKERASQVVGLAIVIVLVAATVVDLG
ncbi:UbiA family prenyltransferase [Demequina mangrovi]|uniref:4-hydroxybenzoate polyprenyltransferase n=1 Tax=Demequina mangrovi TaxID=1043493 RepID=A0A1H6YJ87_9MICO|nr:UbiA family prenyltransferase [Demequina mangrovi]SEJ39884.1 4-hydroxybenzoate polyprenyltransferase [Demequina mangrovi]